MKDAVLTPHAEFELKSPPKIFLIRAIVDIEPFPPEIVTAYRTSKIAKYWREEK